MAADPTLTLSSAQFVGGLLGSVVMLAGTGWRMAASVTRQTSKVEQLTDALSAMRNELARLTDNARAHDADRAAGAAWREALRREFDDHKSATRREIDDLKGRVNYHASRLRAQDGPA